MREGRPLPPLACTSEGGTSSLLVTTVWEEGRPLPHREEKIQVRLDSSVSLERSHEVLEAMEGVW